MERRAGGGKGFQVLECPQRSYGSLCVCEYKWNSRGFRVQGSGFRVSLSLCLALSLSLSCSLSLSVLLSLSHASNVCV
jgi:hypothetical protein